MKIFKRLWKKYVIFESYFVFWRREKCRVCEEEKIGLWFKKSHYGKTMHVGYGSKNQHAKV